MPEADGRNAIYPSLRDRVVLVTGGANGIGACLVERLVAQAAKVAFLDVDDTAAKALVEQLEPEGAGAPLFVRCDLAEIDELRAAIAEVGHRLGPIRVLLNNAANDDRHDFQSVEPADWDRMISVNLRHQFFAAQAVAPEMAAAGGGSIVNFSSISWMGAVENLSVYATAKAGVLGFTRSLARELGPQNIRVNTITPGWTMTERQKRWATPEALDENMRRQCLKTRIDPDAVAGMALFLASDESRMCTGQNFIFDAGTV